MSQTTLFKFIAFACTIASLAAQPVLPVLTEEPFQFAFTQRLYSEHLVEEREFYIHLPSDYDTSTDNYPILLVTDGDAQIFHLSGIVQFLAREDVIPDCILVAVPHYDRESDLLPSRNAEGFTNFLKYELVPYLEQNYRTHPFKVIMGHSYGGLYVTHTLLEHSDFFNGFIAADPSLWWNGRSMENQARDLFTQITSFDKAYYFDQSRISQMGGVEFSAMLEQSAPSDFRWMFLRMSDETHGSIVHQSYYFGLEWVFHNWPDDVVAISPQNRLIDEDETLTVTMRYPNPSAVIRYTTDGTTPKRTVPDIHRTIGNFDAYYASSQCRRRKQPNLNTHAVNP
jgi:predicted alpha/beta superfamily hydrolase